MTTFIRDPLWNNIRVEPFALRLVDTGTFQRLRYVRQLGLAHLVYPGASHSRFEHALGAYHLARVALGILGERGELARAPAGDAALVRVAALLHDVGHYPFSHALEEIGVPHHEEVARPLINDGEVGELLRAEFGDDAPQRVLAMIRGTSTSPLAGLISGSIDLDKIEYLKRDAFMCGVPYGEIDVERLINALVVLDDPAGGGATIGISDKGLSALESLLFAKYQMYRNVYWHHAVRSATAMYKRLVEDALTTGTLQCSNSSAFTDEGLLAELRRASPSALLTGTAAAKTLEARRGMSRRRPRRPRPRVAIDRPPAHARARRHTRAAVRPAARRCARRLSRQDADAVPGPARAPERRQQSSR